MQFDLLFPVHILFRKNGFLGLINDVIFSAKYLNQKKANQIANKQLNWYTFSLVKIILVEILLVEDPLYWKFQISFPTI